MTLRPSGALPPDGGGAALAEIARSGAATLTERHALHQPELEPPRVVALLMPASSQQADRGWPLTGAVSRACGATRCVGERGKGVVWC